MDEIALLENLLKIYSPSDQEAEAVNYLVAQMKAAGFEAFVDPVGNAVGVIGDGPDTVMLLGHIDTVPGFIPVKRDGDKLYGRGAVDAKGPLASFVAATARVGKTLRQDAGRRLVVIGAVGEESDSPGARYAKDQYHPAFTIIGEPSGWEKITLGYKGTMWFEYRVKRSLAHTSTKSESACEAAVGFWNRVIAWTDQFNLGKERMFEQVTPTLRGMTSASDGFVESATLTLNLRLPPSVSVETAHETMCGLLTQAELELLDAVPAYRAEKNTPLVRAFLGGIRKAGGTPSFSLKTGTADMNIVAPIWKTPIVAYGPGDSTLDHTAEEHILISEYQKAIEVLAEVLSTL
jgi:[amino group carrier protein]-lysine/ornithine hydrolase